MKTRSTPRSVAPSRKPAKIESVRLPAGVQRQIEDIYLQLDTQLTRLAEIQLQFDQLRSKIRHL